MEFDALFAYDHAANRRTLDALRQSDAGEDATRLLAHILAAQRVWTERLTTGRAITPVWPDLSLDEAAEWIEENERALADALASSPDLDAPIRYENSRGVAFENTPRGILTHLLLHGAYHRGQLAHAIRQSGGSPPVTDLIAHLREPF
ncbi:MAG: DinB family protein [Bacteroidota bacterium]